MKKFKIIILSLFMFSTIFFNNISINTAIAIENSSNTTAEIVIDAKTNRVLYGKNIEQKKFMASLTKILTAIVIIENCDLNKEIIVDKSTVGVEGSSIYLVEGEKITIKELLYGLMLRSGNDAAETLAVACSGNINDFAYKMNETAKKIGALNSNFVNPHGLHNDNHYTTAYDLALICSYGLKNTVFKEIVSTKKITISNSTKNYKRVLVNKNKLLFNNEFATGIKTGFTKKAGRCLASSFYKNGEEFICVVLNCGPMFERSENLVNEAFNNFKSYKIVSSNNLIDFVDVENSNKKCGLYIQNDVYLTLTEQEKSELNVIYDYKNSLQLPIKKDTEVGNIKFYHKNNLLFSEKIYTIVDINNI